MNQYLLKNRIGYWIRAMLLSLCIAGITGCLTVSETYPPGPRYEAYEPIHHTESHQFVSNALAVVESEFGAPAVPVNQVLIRRSIPLPEMRRYRLASNFSLTRCADSTNGIFVIYISLDPDHDNYDSMLAHECAHLLNPQILDWYMEGLAMVFSEEFCKSTGRPWGSWNRHFNRSTRDPYALSFRMMRQLKAEFPNAYQQIVRYVIPVDETATTFRIDIDGWLATLPDERRKEAVEIIAEYASVLKKKASAQYHFTVPQELR